jgi:hypothetical protein
VRGDKQREHPGCTELCVKNITMAAIVVHGHMPKSHIPKNLYMLSIMAAVIHIMCSQAVTVCSFSPSIYAKGECFLMRRNCMTVAVIHKNGTVVISSASYSCPLIMHACAPLKVYVLRHNSHLLEDAPNKSSKTRASGVLSCCRCCQ